MTYQPCRDCGFNVTPQDGHCPDCGIVNPRSGSKADRRRVTWRRIAMVLGFLLGFLLFAETRVGLLMLAGAIGGAMLGGRAGERLHTRLWKRRTRACLRRDEETIRQRLEALTARGRRLLEVQERIETERRLDGAASGERWQAVLATLGRAAGAIQRQRERYRVKLWEVGLVRWRNTLEPLAADWERLSHDECNRRLQTLETERKRGEGLLREWQTADEADLPEAQACIQQLRSLLEPLETLRQALVGQQAVLAVQGVVPSELAQRAVPASRAVAEQMGQYSARAAVSRFATGFSELETEYMRLESEEQAAQQAVQLRHAR